MDWFWLILILVAGEAIAYLYGYLTLTKRRHAIARRIAPQGLWPDTRVNNLRSRLAIWLSR